MSETGKQSGGGFHFGNIGGAVSQSAGGDIVGGDKHTTTTTTTTTTIQKGFAGEEQKQQFQAQVEELREALRAMKAQIEASSLDEDKKDAAIDEIRQNVMALKEVKEKTAEAPAGTKAPVEIGAKVEDALNRAGGMVDKLEGIAGKAGEVAEAVGKFSVKYGPLLLSARHLFGLP